MGEIVSVWDIRFHVLNTIINPMILIHFQVLSMLKSLLKKCFKPSVE